VPSHNERVYLRADTVLAIHDDQLAIFGGSPGARDMGFVEAAVFRPQSGYYADLLEEAAALWESLSQNHPFVDGSKRVAFAATYTFLVLNGYELQADADAVYTFVMGLYGSNTFTFDHLVAWLRDNTRPL